MDELPWARIHTHLGAHPRSQEAMSRHRHCIRCGLQCDEEDGEEKRVNTGQAVLAGGGQETLFLGKLVPGMCLRGDGGGRVFSH